MLTVKRNVPMWKIILVDYFIQVKLFFFNHGIPFRAIPKYFWTHNRNTCWWDLLWPIYLSERMALVFSCHSSPWQGTLGQSPTCPTIHSSPAEMESVCGYRDPRDHVDMGSGSPI